MYYRRLSPTVIFPTLAKQMLIVLIGKRADEPESRDEQLAFGVADIVTSSGRIWFKSQKISL